MTRPPPPPPGWKPKPPPDLPRETAEQMGTPLLVQSIRPTVFFDFETGGLEDHHPNIQLAAVVVDSAFGVLEQREWKIQFDESTAEREALELNHYDAAVWQREAIPEEQVVTQFKSLIEKHRVIKKTSKAGKRYSVAQLAGHNVWRFDCPRLQAMFKRHGGRKGTFLAADAYLPLDTLQLALWYFGGHPRPPENMRLETLAAWFRVGPPPGFGLHDALGDVLTNVEVARRLLK